ncbi:MAG: pyridoxal-phosphate-dependent aminotransferase family protein [Spirochaetota bacterium]
MKYLLMIPGPVEIPDDILQVAGAQPVAHYGPEWTDFYLNTAGSVSKLLGTKGRTFIIPGSGSAGLDALATSFCTDKGCLVLKNGLFGGRLYDIVSRHTSEVEVLNFPLNAPIDTTILKKRLAEKRYDIVFMTQVETSTGVLNPVEEVSRLVKETGAIFLLDAISSAGIEKLEMDGWSVDAVVTASQKGLECPPGLALVTVQEDMLKVLKTSSIPSWYTNLGVWCEYYEKWHDWHPYPVTLPTSTIIALATSLNIIEKEGIEARQKLYLRVSEKLRKAVSALGLKPYAPDGYYAHGLTAVSTEGKFDPADLIKYLREEAGIQITGSFGEIKSHVFRIGHMSRKQCQISNLISLTGSIACFMASCGIDVSSNIALQKLMS